MSVPVINFRVRTENYKIPTLQGYITIYGEDAPKFSTQVKILQGLNWNQEKQRFTNKSDLAAANNAILDEIRVKLANTFVYMSRLELPINCRTLKAEFLKVWRPDRKKTTLVELYDDFYKVQVERRKTGEIEKKTLDKYDYCKDHLISFLKKNYKSADLDFYLVDAVFGYQFFDYLSKGKPKSICSQETAKRYISYINSCMELAIINRKIKENPLREVKPKVKGKKSKKIIIKESQQLKIFRLNDLTITERHIADITTFLFYTAFDHCDYLVFSQEEHIKVIDKQRVIQKIRYKERKKDNPLLCTILINDVLSDILKRYPTFPKYPDQTVRRIYKNLCSRIEIANSEEYTLKAIRKSGSSFYRNNGVSPKTVSESILGHTTMRMSETHYLVTEPETLIKESIHLLERE